MYDGNTEPLFPRLFSFVAEGYEAMSFKTAFMSHAHFDNDKCDPFADALKKRGISLYYDRANPQVGHSLSKALEEEIQRANVLIVMVDTGGARLVLGRRRNRDVPHAHGAGSFTIAHPGEAGTMPVAATPGIALVDQCDDTANDAGRGSVGQSAGSTSSARRLNASACFLNTAYCSDSGSSAASSAA